MKKNKLLILSLVLSLFVTQFLFTSTAQATTKVPVVSSFEEAEKRGLSTFRIYNNNSNKNSVSIQTDGGYTEYKNYKTTTYNDRNLGYHDDFNDWVKVSGYYFSSSKKTNWSTTLTFNGGPVSLSISAAQGGSAGYIIDANIDKESRPYVTGDVSITTADMYIYDEFGDLITIARDEVVNTSTSDIEIKIAYR